MSEGKNVITELFDNFWILRSNDSTKYFEIKEKLPEAKELIYEKLGYKLINKADLIKLEKIPNKAYSWMGFSDFKAKKDYVFFILLLMYLEKREVRFQFILSDLIEYIGSNYLNNEVIEWESRENRTSVIRVLQFAEKMGIIKIEEFEQREFRDSIEGEALITNTGLSRFFTRHFDEDISNYNGIEDFENKGRVSKLTNLEKESEDARVIKNQIYRELFNTPGLYRSEADSQGAFRYLRRQGYRSIAPDIEKFLGAKLHLHRDAAFVVYDVTEPLKNSIPGIDGLSEMSLQFNKLIVEKVKSGALEVNEEDVIEISRSEFNQLIFEFKDRFSSGWYKKYREEMSLREIESEIRQYMKSSKMLIEDKNNNAIKIMPIVAKITGDYNDNIRSGDDE